MTKTPRKAATAKTWKGPKPTKGRKAGTRTNRPQTALQGGDALAAPTDRGTAQTAQGAALAPAFGGLARITVEIPDGEALAMAKRFAKGAGRPVELLRAGTETAETVEVPTGRVHSKTEPSGKVGVVFALACRTEGADRSEFAAATGWQNGPWPNLLAKVADRYGYRLDIDKSSTPARYFLLKPGASRPVTTPKPKPAKGAKAEATFGKLIEGGNANPVKRTKGVRKAPAAGRKAKAEVPAATAAKVRTPARKVAAAKRRA